MAKFLKKLTLLENKISKQDIRTVQHPQGNDNILDLSARDARDACKGRFALKNSLRKRAIFDRISIVYS